MKFLLAIGLFAFPVIVSAHDFWIEPSTFRPARGSEVEVRLRVGQHYLGDTIPRKRSADLVMFDAHTSKRTTAVFGSEGEDPAGVIGVTDEGLILVAYYNKPAYVKLTEEKVEQYYREEGVESVRGLRARSPYAGEPWRELYSRCAKSLLWTGRGPATLFNKRLGMPLEIIPEKNPYLLGAGSTLPLQLLYRGKPLAGALIVAIPRKEPGRAIALRSDVDGRVRMKLHSAGEWLIKSVHIVPAPEGARGQWESFWASLTFELPLGRDHR